MRYIVLSLLSVFILLGCRQEEALKPSSCKAQVVEKVVVVGCPIRKVDCEFSGENFEPTKKLLECVKLQKMVIEECAQIIDEQVIKNKE